MSEEKRSFLHTLTVEKSPLFLTHFCLPAEHVQKSELTERNEKLRKTPFFALWKFHSCSLVHLFLATICIKMSSKHPEILVSCTKNFSHSWGKNRTPNCLSSSASFCIRDMKCIKVVPAYSNTRYSTNILITTFLLHTNFLLHKISWI